MTTTPTPGGSIFTRCQGVNIQAVLTVESVSLELDLTRWPRVQLAGSADDTAVGEFLDAWDW